MIDLKTISRRQQRAATCNRDPIWVVRWRNNPRSNHWHTEQVFATQQECSEFIEKNRHNYREAHPYALNANGALAALLNEAMAP